MLRAHAGRGMRQISIEVAEHVLARHVARTGDDLVPYRVVVSRGCLPSRDAEFVDMDGVHEERRLRAGRMVTVNRAYRLQQRLAAEAFIARRWPQHRSHVIDRDMLSGLDFDGISFFRFGRGRKKTG